MPHVPVPRLPSTHAARTVPVGPHACTHQIVKRPFAHISHVRPCVGAKALLHISRALIYTLHLYVYVSMCYRVNKSGGAPQPHTHTHTHPDQHLHTPAPEEKKKNEHTQRIASDIRPHTLNSFTHGTQVMIIAPKRPSARPSRLGAYNYEICQSPSALESGMLIRG